LLAVKLINQNSVPNKQNDKIFIIYKYVLLSAETQTKQKIFSTRWLHCVEGPQYSIQLEALDYLCTSCLLPSRMPATEWCKHYLPCYLNLQFPIQACFSSTLVSQAAQWHTWFINIEHWTSPKICFFFVRSVQDRGITNWYQWYKWKLDIP